MAWSPDGTRIATGSHDDTVRLWDAEAGVRVRRFDGHTGDVWDVAFSPDGARLASASSDGSARIWEVGTGEELLRFEDHEGDVFALDWSHNGTLIATGGDDSAVRIWDADDGTQHSVLPHDDRGWGIWGIAFSSEDRWLATSAADRARVWEIESGDPILELTGATNDVDGVAWSPDDKTVVTGSDDSVVRVYNTSDLADLARAKSGEGPMAFVTRCFSREEREQLFLKRDIPDWCPPS